MRRRPPLMRDPSMPPLSNGRVLMLCRVVSRSRRTTSWPGCTGCGRSIGRFSTFSWSMHLAARRRRRFEQRRFAVTRISSVIAPMVSVTSTRRRSPDRSSRSRADWTEPARVNVTRYFPLTSEATGRRRPRCVTAVVLTFVFELTAVAVTPGRAAPCGSLSVPVIELCSPA